MLHEHCQVDPRAPPVIMLRSRCYHIELIEYPYDGVTDTSVETYRKSWEQLGLLCKGCGRLYTWCGILRSESWSPITTGHLVLSYSSWFDIAFSQSLEDLVHHNTSSIIYPSVSVWRHMGNWAADCSLAQLEECLDMAIEWTKRSIRRLDCANIRVMLEWEWKCTWRLWSSDHGIALEAIVQACLEIHFWTSVKRNWMFTGRWSILRWYMCLAGQWKLIHNVSVNGHNPATV